MAALEPSEANLKVLAGLLQQTLSGDNKALKAGQKTPDIGSPGATNLISMPSVAPFLVSSMFTEAGLKQSAAITFKNFIARCWDYENSVDKETGLPDKITANDRNIIKQNLIPLMGTQPKIIQAQLGEGLAKISNCDFPHNWSSLLPELVSRIEDPGMDAKPEALLGVLEVMHSIFYRYRHELKSQKLWEEIKIVLDKVCEPLSKLFLKWVARLGDPAHANNATTLPIIINILALVLENFLSLNSQDIAEQFEEVDIKSLWFNNSLELLKYSNPVLEPANKNQEDPTKLDQVKATICEIINLFTWKYEDAFAEFVPKYVPTIWNLLTSLSDAKRFDLLVNSAVKFLTSVVKKAQFKSLFDNPEALKALCEKVIIPQLKLRDTDIEVFEDNPSEYIRIDIEGSDVDTRRRTTVDFIHGLTQHFEQQITTMLKGYVDFLLGEYEKNKKTDKGFLAKDAAMYIILALSAKKSSLTKGVTETNPYVDIGAFFTSQVIPELTSASNSSGGARDIILADCLKYVSVFRQQLPKNYCEQLMPVILKFLTNEHMVLHTYAAYSIEKLLSVKDGANLRFDKESLRPYLQKLLEGLFGVLKMEESRENEYVMKAIMRVCSVGQDAMIPFAAVIIQNITGILSLVAQNPRNPKFNHCMFETIAALIKYLCKSNPALIESFEQSLFTPFGTMLNMESAADFSPYVFQILAQLLELRPDMSPPYVSIFPSILVPTVWTNQGNVPAVTRLLQTYLRKPNSYALLFQGNQRFNGVLGIFAQLLRLKSTEAFGLDLLTSIIVDLDLNIINKDLVTVFQATLFPKLQPAAKPTPRLFKGTVMLFLAFIAKHGFETVHAMLNQIQPNIFAMIMDKIILPNLHFITSEPEKKLVAVVLTDLLTKTPTFLREQAYLQLWPKVLVGLARVLTKKDSREVASITSAVAGTSAANLIGEAEEGDADDLLFQSEKGFSTSYAKLVFAASGDRDYTPASVTATPLQYAVTNLNQVFNQYPGQFPAMLNALPQADSQAVGTFFQQNQIVAK